MKLACYSFEKLTNFISAAKSVSDARHKVFEPTDVIVSFKPALNFFSAAKSADKSVKVGIKGIERMLGNGIDSLSFPWNKHRQLKCLNENVYTDWLAWTLEVVQAEVASLGDLIIKLFPRGIINLKKIPQGTARILRETPVEQGHNWQTGRTDLIVDFVETSFVWHIEVKVTPAESSDMGKNTGYFKSLKKKFPKKTICNFILVTSANQEIYHEGEGSFKVITWKQLCQSFRQWIRSRERFHLVDYQCLMFCGMVEHFLLKICPGSINHLNYLKKTYEIKQIPT